MLERHLFARTFIKRGSPRQLTTEPGWHITEISPDFRRFIDHWSSIQKSPAVVLKDIDGQTEAVLFDQPDITPANLGLQPPELTTITTRDDVSLHAAIYNPPEIEPGRRYPLVVSVYGGPHAQMVINSWGLTMDLRAQYLAQQGFVVLKVDNRGSANRGLAFEAPIDRNMGEIEVQDQVDGVREIAQRDYVDGERVGVYGWSYGGYMTVHVAR